MIGWKFKTKPFSFFFPRVHCSKCTKVKPTLILLACITFAEGWMSYQEVWLPSLQERTYQLASPAVLLIHGRFNLPCKSKSWESQNNPVTTSQSTKHLSPKKKIEVEISFPFLLLFIRISILLYLTSRIKEVNTNKMPHVTVFMQREIAEKAVLCSPQSFRSVSQWKWRLRTDV